MSGWKPPQHIESLFETLSGNTFASINRPTAGARNDDPVEVGDAPLQLYSLATPNGQKVGILLEELGVEYDAHVVRLTGQQFSKGFTQINPNGKIPGLVDRGEEPPVNLFESGSIMVYLADKYGKFIPKTRAGRAECLNWVFWQMAGQGPITGGCYGHFFVYAPETLNRDYAVARYGMEVQRLCSVLDGRLSDRRFLCGDEYTIADMICLPWFHILRTNGYTHSSGVASRDFLNIAQYRNANRWAEELVARPQVQRGMLVCRKYPKPWLQSQRYMHLAKL